MAILKIVRDSGYPDRLRAYQVIADETRIGEIRSGQTNQVSTNQGNTQLLSPLRMISPHHRH